MHRRKRTFISLSTKQDARRLLSVLPYGTTSLPLIYVQTKKPQNPISVAEMLKFPCTALYQWRQRASEILAVPQKDAKRLKTIRKCDFDSTKRALRTYVISTIQFIQQTPPFS